MWRSLRGLKSKQLEEFVAPPPAQPFFQPLESFSGIAGEYQATVEPPKHGHFGQEMAL